MGIKDINQQRQNTFKSVELERKTKKAHDIETFIENAEGETSKKRYGAPLKDKEKKAQRDMVSTALQQKVKS